jgi:hypothetical protein
VCYAFEGLSIKTVYLRLENSAKTAFSFYPEGREFKRGREFDFFLDLKKQKQCEQFALMTELHKVTLLTPRTLSSLFTTLLFLKESLI